MTWRAVIIGMIGGVLLNAFAFLNDLVLHQSFLVGSYLPVPVYGGLLLAVIAYNPLARKWGPRFALTGRELALVAALLLAFCYVPGRGLGHYFLTTQMLPHYYETTHPPFANKDITEMAPERMLADPSVDDGKSLDDYILGKKEVGSNMAFSDIPWAAWRRSLAFWLPLLITFSVAMVALAITVHRQWSQHEHLAYPIAYFADAVFGHDDQGVGLTGQRLFWYGLLPVMAIHLWNYLGVWQSSWIDIPLTYRFGPLAQVWPFQVKGPLWQLLNPRLFFVVIGFAYFLPSQTSFSLALAPWVFAVAIGALSGYGVALGSGGLLSPNLPSFFYAGAFAAMFAALVYTGRHYYWHTLRAGFGLKTTEAPDRNAVWGVRVFGIAVLLFVLQLVAVGLDWQLALLYTLMMAGIMLVLSRIVAETGAFFVHVWFFPCVLLVALLGERNIGPSAAVTMMLVSTLLLIDPREALLPFVAHGLKIADKQKLRLAPVARGSVLAVVVAFAVAVPASLYWSYNEGLFQASDGWTRGVPRLAFGEGLRIERQLQAQGSLEAAESISGFSRFLDPRPNVAGYAAFLVVFGLTLGCAWGRIKFHWWPLHPVLFCVLGTFQSAMLAGSFLVGCLVKMGISHFGGYKTYNLLKPLMLGLIAGEMLGGLIPMIISLLFFMITGESPPAFTVFRG